MKGRRKAEARYIRIRIDLNRRQGILAMAGLLFACGIMELSSESMTLTTYYPSPAGIYQKLTSTQKTLLARDAGNVGVGTASPTTKLDVAGEIRLASTGLACDPATNVGAMRYNSDKQQTEVCTPQGWTLPPGAFGGGFQTCDVRSENCPPSLCYTPNPIAGNACDCPAGFSAFGFRAEADLGGTLLYRQLQGTGIWLCVKRDSGVVQDNIPGGPEPYPR